MTTVRVAAPEDAAELADLAALTFPLAAPAHVTDESLATFIEQHLSAHRITDYLADPAREVTVAEDAAGRLVGYTLIVFEQPTDLDVAAVVTFAPAAELSKIYAHPDAHGAGVASELMRAAVQSASDRRCTGIWLGVNQENARAQRFYEKAGFSRVGTKRFQVGTGLEYDYVYAMSLSQPGP